MTTNLLLFGDASLNDPCNTVILNITVNHIISTERFDDSFLSFKNRSTLPEVLKKHVSCAKILNHRFIPIIYQHFKSVFLLIQD